MKHYLLLAALAPVVLSGCQRNTAEAGVKPVGVGFDPGDLFSGPSPKGGVIDYVLMQFRGNNLDLGATGLYFSTGAFTDVTSDPFDAVFGYGLLFSPAIVAADEYQLISPKGPDIADACVLQIAARGPLGSFRTVDVGDQIVLSNQASDPTMRSEMILPRDPQTYPTNTTSVSLNYLAALPLVQGNNQVPDNWVFDEDVYLHFTGGLPPENAPVASIPRPSDAADDSVVPEKEAGDPLVHAPIDLGLVMVSNREDGEDAVAMRFSPGNDLPDPRLNDGVIHVSWQAPPEDDRVSEVTVSIKVLGPDPGEPLDDGNLCIPAAPVAEDDKDAAGLWLTEYTDGKSRWCDPGWEPDPSLGNDEFGLDYDSADDTCHNGEDDNNDGLCDESGCLADDGVTWLSPDPNCGRHELKTLSCGSDGLCRRIGGDRNPEGHLADLVCTATDDGQFTVAADMIEEMIAAVGDENARGALLSVARITENEITVPMVRNQIGNQDDINPVRFRAAQVEFGRLGWE